MQKQGGKLLPREKESPGNSRQKTNARERKYQERLEKLKGLRPMDDDFLRVMFRDNLPLAQMTLRIIMKKEDLVLTSFHTQEDMKQITGARSICLDAYAVDGEGRCYDLEIQRADAGADPHRARYHSSMLDVKNLRAGQEFTELPDTYVIFITEKDFFRRGKALYAVERTNRGTDEPYGDGSHIIYVNGEYQGEDDLGRLMHDFNCSKADEMHYELMAEKTRYLKETAEGVRMMCKIVEEMCDESREEGREEGTVFTLSALVRDGILPMEDAAVRAGMTVDELRARIRELENAGGVVL